MEKCSEDKKLCVDEIRRIEGVLSSLPSEKDFQVKTDLFKALSDTTRLKILYLLNEEEMCVCELIYALDKPQSTTSHHLNVLKNAGLIKSRKEGVWMHYTLSCPESISTIFDLK